MIPVEKGFSENQPGSRENGVLAILIRADRFLSARSADFIFLSNILDV